MKRFLLAVAAVAFVASSEAEAAQRTYYRPAYRQAYRPMRSYSYSNSYSQGPFSRLMELERAKNAWLRQTFMGY